MKIFRTLPITLCLLQASCALENRRPFERSPDVPCGYYEKGDPRYQSCESPEASGESSGFIESHHPNEVTLDHKYFMISYNAKHRLPNWVSYKLNVTHVSTKNGKRRDKFFADPKVIAMSLAYAKPTDFDGKIYDRGHMAPSEDFVWSQEANDQTFVMTNMAPQKRALNRGSWKKLEAKVRGWACTEKEMTVVSGPFLTDELPKMKSGVSIPKKFFKIVIDETPPRKAMAFVYSQDDGKKDLRSAVTSVGDVEKVTGFEFIIAPDTKERTNLRTKFNLNDWTETDCSRKSH